MSGLVKNLGLEGQGRGLREGGRAGCVRGREEFGGLVGGWEAGARTGPGGGGGGGAKLRCR